MIDFYGKRKVYFTISLSIIIVSLLVSIIFGVKMDIQFKGGSILSYSYEGKVDLNDFEKKLEEFTGTEFSVQESTDVKSGMKSFVASSVNSKGVDSNTQFELLNKLKAAYPSNSIASAGSSSVDPVMGKEFFLKSIVAIAFASLLIIIYIGFRFKKIGGWSAGVMAVVALFHDCFVVFATFVFFRIPLNDNFIAVILTILGFSVNDTIVIYDRIRENKKLFGTKLTLPELVNKSINQSLSRSIVTSACTILSMVVVLVVCLMYNVSSIYSFALPMIIGMISGVYSTICIAGPLWVMWLQRERKPKKA